MCSNATTLIITSTGPNVNSRGDLAEPKFEFLCEEGAGDYISQITEFESCRYEITVHTGRVCRHPFLRPVPKKQLHPILCNPILEMDKYEIFQMVEQEKKKAAEEMRTAWLQKQEETLTELKTFNDGTFKNLPLNKDFHGSRSDEVVTQKTGLQLERVKEED